MKRTNWVLIIIAILISPRQTICQEFNDALLTKANTLKDRFSEEFENSALLIKNYKITFETQPIDIVYQNFNDFINDTASNYFAAMYDEVHNQTTGVPYVKYDICPPTDPLAISLGQTAQCSLTIKDEYALEQTSDTLVAIAYEYSRKLKQLGSDIIKETGLLDKVIEMKTQQLVSTNLPSMIVQDATWINQFKTEEISVRDKLWNETKQVAQKTGDDLIKSLKDDLYDLAGESLDAWIESAKSSSGPLMQEIKEYRKKLTEAEKDILTPLEEITKTIDEKLLQVKDTTSEAAESFISYIDSIVESLLTDTLIQPFQKTIKSITDKITSTNATPIISNVSDSLEKATQEALNKITTGITDISSRLQKELSNLTDKFTNPIIKLNSKTEKYLTSLTNTKLTDQLPKKIKTEVDAQLTDITSSFSKITNEITQDITTLTSDFTQPISKSLDQLDKDIKNIKNLNPFAQASAEFSLSIQTSVKETTDIISKATSDLANGIENISIQLKNAFNTESKDIQNILTQSVTTLTDTASNVRGKIVDYLNDKIKIITDLVKLIDEIIAKLENVKGRDFIDLAESFILSPTKTLQTLENLTTCKIIDDKGKCSQTYVDYLEQQLNVANIPDDLAEFYKTIISDLKKSFETFVTNIEKFVKEQEEKTATLFDQTINVALATGKTTKDTLIASPDTIKQLIKTIEKQSLNQAKTTLDQLNKIKKNLAAITDNFGKTSSIDDVTNAILKNKNNAKKVIQSLPGKIDTLSTLVKDQAKGKADELLTQLDELKEIATSYSKLLTKEISSENLMQNLQESATSVDSLKNDVTKGALESVSAIIDQLNNLKNSSKTLSTLINDGKEILNAKIFGKIKEIMSNLDIAKLDTLNQIKKFADYNTTLQSTINSIISNLKDSPNTTPTLLKEGATFVTAFDTTNIARQVQVQLQNQLDPTILKFITIERDDKKLTIKPNFISVATEKFYELIDDAIVLITDKLNKAFQTFS